MAGNNRRVTKYRKRRNINIGIIIFGITFIYIVINVFLYFSRDQVTIYEVVEGKTGSSTDNYFTGVILRDEVPLYASVSGYINYFQRNASHVSIGTGLYTVDESGQLAATIAEKAEEGNILTEESIGEIRDSINEFTLGFSASDFSTVYDLKYGMESLIFENYNTSLLTSVDMSQFQIVTSPQVGTFLNYTDGYEGLTSDTITASNFDETVYSKKAITSGDLTESGSSVGKIVTSDVWTLIIQLNDSQYEKYKDKTSLKVKFVDNDLTSFGDFSVMDKDGVHFGVLRFDKFGIHFFNDRFLDIKILDSETSGFKVPKTSVVEKDFYVIPVEFLATGGNNSEKGFYKQVFTDKMEASVVFVAPDIYYQSDKYCYVQTSAFKEGDIVVKNDSNSQFQVGETEPLKGVYNVNNGYTNFRQIVILGETSDYYIVAQNTSFGLRIYDNIILDVSGTKENQVIYQ
ncbi:HlyD family efflux transporter periplasmic adaptor subunit [Parasporobacterium paucivorans]|uniref:HlyD family secretion protein n=1 Tax=Parasporobacterium paucivorans DSM 15970 TaxID=1122934 RepID=A0A1M6A3S6_9FIRM|nr:HlyD family efflux transporter periplasmic adaptor subunit [Parasporobacterium paucivorans]SHI30989.1 hypothetical protein SAMN02745691_00049 [Parasporobacterium paucivorans DSM 15970]